MASIIEVKTITLRTIWEQDELATLDLIKPLMEDMFGDDQSAAFKATREYSIEVLSQGQMAMGNLEVILSSFYDGYEACEKARCQN